MNGNDSRDLRQVEYYWSTMQDVDRWLVAVAVIINREMRTLANMKKTNAAYLIAALFVISITGIVISYSLDNTTMGIASGGMLAFTVMVSLYYLVWRYLR